ncbi:MAG: 2-dehydropantoate 2-reductase N-terminal domain-containing protein [Pseudomonadota bacterium]
MRIIIYGLGAIGGGIAGALASDGLDVIAIARGAMLDAVRSGPLRIRRPNGEISVNLPVMDHPSRIDFRPDDLILLTMKTQDTQAALHDLRAAGVRDQPIFCAQNGITNEDFALRVFPNVHGMTVVMPATYVTPGEVIAPGMPKIGYFDIGRYPTGSDADDHRLADALGRSQFAGFVHNDVMSSKRGKLLMNTRNVLSALLGDQSKESALRASLWTEAEAVFSAAGLTWQPVEMTDPRRSALMTSQTVAGAPSIGGSTAQSLARATGHVETDYLNGEVARLGRLHNVPTPVNAFFADFMPFMVAQGVKPGDMTPAELDAHYAKWASE